MKYLILFYNTFSFGMHYASSVHCASSGADSVGHPLTSKELLALKDYVLSEDVIESLQQEGLDLNTIGNVQTTIEEVQRRLDSLGQSEIASNLQQRLDIGKHLKLVNFTIHTYNDRENLQLCTGLKQSSGVGPQGVVTW